MSAVDGGIVGAAGTTVVGLAGVAGATSRSTGRWGPEATGLEAAARVVRDQLVAHGEPVNRRNLATGLRSAGHRVPFPTVTVAPGSSRSSSRSACGCCPGTARYPVS